MKLFQKLLISTVATTFVVPVLAQDTLKITVTGTRTERSAETFPGSIDVMDLEEINTKNTGDTIDTFLHLKIVYWILQKLKMYFLIQKIRNKITINQSVMGKKK